MGGSGKKILIVLGLAVYVLVVAGLAVFYKFPYDKAARVGRERLEAGTPARLFFEKVKPGLPFNYSIENLTFDLDTPDGPASLFRARRLHLSVSPLGFLSGRAAVDFRAEALGGGVDGRIDYTLTGQRKMVLKVETINLPEFMVVGPRGALTVSGPLAGSLEIVGDQTALPREGKGVFKMGPGRISGLKNPSLPFTQMDFDSLEVEFQLRPSQIVLKRFEARSKQGFMSMTGRVTDLNTWRLNFTGQAGVGPVEKPLFTSQFRVGGSFFQPQIQIMSGPNQGKTP